MHPRSRDLYVETACLAIIVLAQATLLSRVRLFGVSPDLLLVSVVCWSLARGVRGGLIWSFGGGLGIDLIAGAPLGRTALTLLPTSWLGNLGRTSIFGNHALLPILLAALATPLRGWLMLLIQQMGGARVDWLASTVQIIGPEMVLNAVLAFGVYPVLRWLAARLNPSPTEI